ncbi:hypothetical protein ADUPG1_010447, partial [Aduncisulcus paluster]
CPIPRDVPNIVSPDFPSIKATLDLKYDGSLHAQRLLKGIVSYESFSRISIPFSPSSRIRGAYICLNGLECPEEIPSYLKFTFTSSTGVTTTKRFKFLRDTKDIFWYKIPIHLPDVALCEISRKKEKDFSISSLVFFRKETHEEIKAREAREKLWSEAPVVKAEFVKEGDEESQGRDSIPIQRDDPKLVKPSFSMVKCKDDSYSKESKYYENSLDAQRMLKGEYGVDSSSHLSIPFPSPCPMEGAYICVDMFNSLLSLLFTFTDCYGKKTYKKYEFSEPKHYYEWHFLPIDLDIVVLCEIEGKRTWGEQSSRRFCIFSLIFTRQEEIEIIERLSLLPWK